MAVDKTITCRDCAVEFVFTVREQEFFAERGFGDPVRCINCRRALKAKRQGDADGAAPAGRSGDGFQQRPAPSYRPHSDRPQGDRPQGGFRPQSGPRREFDPRGRGPRPEGRPESPRPSGGSDLDSFPELRPNYRAEPALAGGGGRETGPRFREHSPFQPDYPKKRKKLNSGRPQVEDDGSGWEAD